MTDPNWRTRPRFWTPARLFELAGYIEQGWTDERIARRMGRTVNAVQLARKRNGLRSRTEELLSCRAVAWEMGVSCSKTVRRWIVQGYLRGRRGQPRGANRQWYVRREDLVAFLENPAFWHLWEPERIRDPWQRRSLMRARNERYLTTGEVAERFYVEHRTVNQWIHRGVLPAVRRGNWLIPASALVAFMPPSQRGKQGMRVCAWSADEDAELLRRRATGLTFREIAQALDRNINSVANRYYRLIEHDNERQAT